MNKNIKRGLYCKMEKAKTYEQLVPQVEALIKDVDNHVGALANVSALIIPSLFLVRVLYRQG